MNHLTLRYKARASYIDGNNKFHNNELHDITHIINVNTLQTVSLAYKPVQKVELSSGEVIESNETT